MGATSIVHISDGTFSLSFRWRQHTAKQLTDTSKSDVLVLPYLFLASSHFLSPYDSNRHGHLLLEDNTNE